MTAQQQKDEAFMELALAQARLAAAAGEAPIGALIVQADRVLVAACNNREQTGLATGHAELLAIEAACRMLGGWRLADCTLYVTLEPCPMCAGAIINARISRVVFGAFDTKAGCFGSLIDLSKVQFNHAPRLSGGVRKEESRQLLETFFAKIRGTDAQKTQE